MADLNEEFRYSGPEVPEFVRVDAAGLEDFSPFILPNVLSALNGLEDWEDARAFVIGITLDGTPSGALVGSFREFNEIFLHSVMVKQRHRRMGLGCGLLRCAIQFGLSAFPEGYGDTEEETRIFVHTDYSLPEPEYHTFERFLRAVGFQDFSADPTVCILPARALCSLSDSPVKVSCLAEAAGEDFNAFCDLFEDMGLDTRPELVFFLGDPQTPGCMILAADDGGGDYFVSSVMLTDALEPTAEPTVSENEYRALIGALADAVSHDAPEAEFYVDCSRNVYSALWECLAREQGLVCPRQEAGLYAIID